MKLITTNKCKEKWVKQGSKERNQKNKTKNGETHMITITLWKKEVYFTRHSYLLEKKKKNVSIHVN